MRTLLSRWRCLPTDVTAGILVETAVFLPFLVLVFFGLVEITQFIDVKERTNRIINQVGDVYGGLTPGSVNAVTLQNEWDTTIKAVLTDMASPHGINVNLTFCSPDAIFADGAGGYTTQFSLATNSPGICGYGDRGIAATPVPPAPCPPPGGFQPGLHDLVVLTAGCNYSPMFNFFNLFPSGFEVRSGPLVLPLRSGNLPVAP